MAKNRKKEKSKDAASMDITVENSTGCTPQAMDTSEGTTIRSSSLMNANRKIKKSIPMKRSKSLRKRKALERAISNSEKSAVKMTKNTDKKLRVQSAKTLYD